MLVPTTSSRASFLFAFALGACLLGTSGCFVTSIGMENPQARAEKDFGPPQTLKVCALLDDGISQGDAQQTLADEWNQGEASKYNLSVQLVSYSSLPRPTSEFFHWQIARKLAMRQIPPQCDRVMYFVNRNALDALWSVPELYGAPEILGEVDDFSMTKGYVVDRVASLNQVLMLPWFSPEKVARHEAYHMVGCGHDLVMNECYEHIAEAKWLAKQLDDAGCYEKSGVKPFFPSFSNAGAGPIMLTREQAEGMLGLEKNLPFQNFTRCARGAGLPLDPDGKLQTAEAQVWMDRMTSAAHRESLPPAVASTPSGEGVKLASASAELPRTASLQPAILHDNPALPSHPVAAGLAIPSRASGALASLAAP
jgi:hypothetical protein